MTTGRRYGGAYALAAGLVTAIAGETDVVPSAMDLVQPLAGKDPEKNAGGTIKARMFAPVVAAPGDQQSSKLGSDPQRGAAEMRSYLVGTVRQASSNRADGSIERTKARRFRGAVASRGEVRRRSPASRAARW